MRRQADYWVLRRIRMIADYQFFVGAGLLLFPDNVDVYTSPRTGKIKEIRSKGVHLASLNPKSGLFSLSIHGAKRLDCRNGTPFVVVKNTVSSEVSRGGNVFSKHVTHAGSVIRPGSEAVVFSEDSSLLAVGHSLLSGDEAKRFKRGVAIKVRRGVDTRHAIQKDGPKGNASSNGKDGAQT